MWPFSPEPRKWYTHTVEELRNIFYDRAKWELKFCWLPKHCLASNKRIWLEFAYRGRAMYTGPGDVVFEDQWHNKVEHIIWQLKR